MCLIHSPDANSCLGQTCSQKLKCGPAVLRITHCNGEGANADMYAVTSLLHNAKGAAFCEHRYMVCKTAWIVGRFNVTDVDAAVELHKKRCKSTQNKNIN